MMRRHDRVSGHDDSTARRVAQGANCTRLTHSICHSK